MDRKTLLRKAIAIVKEEYDADVIDCHAFDNDVQLIILCGGYEPARVRAFANDKDEVEIYFK